MWMYRRYVIPSLHHDLAVNGISVYISKKLNSLATRYIKKWLGLTRSTTVTVIHHASVLNIPTLESCSTSAKLNYLAAVTLPPDPMIAEISHFSLSNNFSHAHGISDLAKDALSAAINSVQSISRKTIPKSAHAVHMEARKEKWDLKLEELTVQTKFSDACSLEKENRVWNQIKDSLTPGQLSFILWAASDTLPTPLNLHRWKIRTDSKCNLCNSIHPTVNHILNAFPPH